MRVLPLTLGLILGLVGVTYAQSAAKIGYVDIQRVISESKAGIAASAALQEDLKKKEDIINQEAKQIIQMRNNFMSKNSVMSKEAQEQEADQIENMEKELHRKREDFRDALAEQESNLKEKILSDVVRIVNEIGNSEGYSLIVEKSEAGVLYGSKSADITDEVIRAYDKKYEEKKGVSKR
ncbi:MAG: hypothetical protein C4291_03990 [Candidatus Dadabacteria bacterium]